MFESITLTNKTASRADAAAIELKETEALTLELAADQAVRFEVSGALDATVSVLRDGELVARSGERGNGNVLTVRAPSKGRYLVAVSGKDARSFGPFALNSTPIQAYSGGPLQPGQSTPPSSGLKDAMSVSSFVRFCRAGVPQRAHRPTCGRKPSSEVMPIRNTAVILRGAASP